LPANLQPADYFFKSAANRSAAKNASVDPDQRGNEHRTQRWAPGAICSKIVWWQEEYAFSATVEGK
jgi:hypothetical protein